MVPFHWLLYLVAPFVSRLSAPHSLICIMQPVAQVSNRNGQPEVGRESSTCMCLVMHVYSRNRLANPPLIHLRKALTPHCSARANHPPNWLSRSPRIQDQNQYGRCWMHLRFLRRSLFPTSYTAVDYHLVTASLDSHHQHLAALSPTHLTSLNTLHPSPVRIDRKPYNLKPELG